MRLILEPTVQESEILLDIYVCSAWYIQTKCSFSGVEITLETPEPRRIHMQTVLMTTRCCRLDPSFVISKSPLNIALSISRCCLKTHCIRNQNCFLEKEFPYFHIGHVWLEGSTVCYM